MSPTQGAALFLKGFVPPPIMHGGGGPTRGAVHLLSTELAGAMAREQRAVAP